MADTLRFLGLLAIGIVIAAGCGANLSDDCEYLGKCPKAGPSFGGNGGSSAGGSANGGNGGVDPCAGACKGDTPVCLESTQTCVECVTDSACRAPKATCDTVTHACVECNEDAHCKDPAKPLCNKRTHACVACLADENCTNPNATRCETGACGPCTDNAQCKHITGRGLCDRDSGMCVQCTAGDESACGGNSCNPATNQCTTTPLGSKDLCEACVADGECIGGNQPDPDTRCVPMKFVAATRTGGFCLKREAKTCESPYKVPFTARSLSGAASESYCGIDQSSTRCEAVLDLTRSIACPDAKDTSCGCPRDADGKCTEPGQGGLCRKVLSDSNMCTIPCAVAAQCKSPLTCGGVAYCH